MPGPPPRRTETALAARDAGPSVAEAERAQEEKRLDRLFPNCLKVAGVKHICDNLLGSTLHSLPQRLCFNFNCVAFAFFF